MDHPYTIHQALAISLPSLLSHQLQRTIRVHREVLGITDENTLPCQCHVVSALNYGCACINETLFVMCRYPIVVLCWLIERHQ